MHVILEGFSYIEIIFEAMNYILFYLCWSMPSASW